MTANAGIVEEHIHGAFGGFAKILRGGGPVFAVADIELRLHAIGRADFCFDSVEARGVYVIEAAKPAPL